MKLAMKKIVIATVLSCLGFWAVGQQVPFYSQYYFNPFVYNASLAGYSGEVQAYIGHRNQWTGIQGAPLTTSFTLDGPIKGEKAGLGLNLYNDQTDILQRTGIRAAYSYGISINDEHRLRLGLGGGFINSKIDYSRAVVENSADPNLFTSAQSKAGVDFDFGVSYFWKDLQVGVVLPHLLDNSLEYNKLEEGSTVQYGLSRHYIATVRYDYAINDDYTIIPMVLTRATPGTPFQWDFNLLGSYQDIAWLGATYKHQYAIGVNAGFKVNEKFHVSGTYDVITSDIGGYAGNSTEFMIGYTFGTSQAEKEAEMKRREELRQELDSLKAKLSETSDKTDQNRQAIDSLGNELDKVKVEVDEAIEELKKNPPVSTGGGTDGGAGTDGGGTTPEENLYSDDYLDNKGEPLPKGFYIVVGSYSEQKWARQAKKRFVNAGFPETDILYNITNKFYNVFLSFTVNEEEARKNLKNARAEYPDAWLRVIK